MTHDVNDIVNEALPQWLKASGLQITPLEGGGVSYGSVKVSSLSLISDIEKLNQSRELDPSGITALMMIRHSMEEYLEGRQVSIRRLIVEPEDVESEIQEFRKLFLMLASPKAAQAVSEFKQMMETATSGYFEKGLPEEVKKVISDTSLLGRIRFDAFRAITKLGVHQFAQGEKDPSPLKYNPQVFEFWSMNSLVGAMASQKVSGITLCLIRPPQELRSFFAFAIRNGGTLTILTDKPNDPHPAFARMARRPERDLDRRADDYWFPYHLLDMDPVRPVAKERDQLVLADTEGVPLAKITDLTPHQVVWLTMAFELILNRFWFNDEKTPELSYTGQMITEPKALAEQANSLVPAQQYKALELPRITRADLAPEKLADQWDRPNEGFNHWMVERYQDKVPEHVLNLVADPNKLLTDGKEEHRLTLRDAQGPRLELEAFDPTAFGTPEQVQRDRLWVARMNQVKVVQQLAYKEFDKNRDKVNEWYVKAVRDNLPFLLNAVARGELVLPRWKPKQFGGRKKSVIEPTQSLQQEVAERPGKPPKWFWYHSGLKFFVATRTKYMCYEDVERVAYVFSDISVNCPEAIAVVCGTTVDKLPWPLQHYYDEEPYDGNQILDRLDPETWALENPWVKGARSMYQGHEGLKLDLRFAHSKVALNARRKSLGLPPLKYKAGEKVTNVPSDYVREDLDVGD